MRYEYKKLFSSKLMWLMLILTFGYMAFLPLLANMVFFVKLDNSEKASTAVLAAYDRLRIYLPQSLLNFKEYIKQFDCFSLFGQPVSRLSACIFISLAVSLLCVIFGYKLSGRTRRSA